MSNVLTLEVVADEPTQDATPDQTPDQTPEPTVEVAPVAKASDRYPADEVRLSLQARIIAAHKVGWTRPMIQTWLTRVKIDAELTEPVPAVDGDGFTMGGSAVWRVSQGRIQTPEVPYVTRVLDWIEQGVIQLPEKTGKVAAAKRAVSELEALQARVTAALELIDGSGEVKTAKALRETLEATRAALTA